MAKQRSVCVSGVCKVPMSPELHKMFFHSEVSTHSHHPYLFQQYSVFFPCNHWTVLCEYCLYIGAYTCADEQKIMGNTCAVRFFSLPPAWCLHRLFFRLYCKRVEPFMELYLESVTCHLGSRCLFCHLSDPTEVNTPHHNPCQMTQGSEMEGWVDLGGWLLVT